MKPEDKQDKLTGAIQRAREELDIIESLLKTMPEKGCVACQLSAISDPRCSQMKHTCEPNEPIVSHALRYQVVIDVSREYLESLTPEEQKRRRKYNDLIDYCHQQEEQYLPYHMQPSSRDDWEKE